jgi:hypothetical protein
MNRIQLDQGLAPPAAALLREDGWDAVPGKPFAEIGAEVRKRSPFAFTMFRGYSDGIGGNYMPTSQEYAHGGYEVKRTPTAPSPTAPSSKPPSAC